MQSTKGSRQRMADRRRRNQRILIFAIILMLLGITLLLPPIRTRIGYRLEDLRVRIAYRLNPPEQSVFIPQEQGMIETVVAETMAAMEPTMALTAANTPGPDSTPIPSETPIPTYAPIPAVVDLREQVTYVHQHGRWNYCGPANLTMALKYWGWEGDRDQVAEAIKPGPADPSMDYIDRTRVDKNVMPYEMVNFANAQPGMRAFERYGGDIDLLQRLIANGYPVVVEKGYYEYSQITNSVDWMGHYLFVTGYNQPEGYLIVQDAYLKEGDDYIGENYIVPMEEFIKEWRYFNYLFILVYPVEAEAEVFELVGPWLDENWADHHAMEIALKEIGELEGLDLFFAWFNKGTSHVQLFEYVDAAFAYDHAFQVLYPSLTADERPWRLMWYQTGPYFAYFYSARYQDVINLANVTLYENISEPTLEESFYWRGMARLAIGETGNGVDDIRESVRLNPNFGPGIEKLQELGVSP